MTNYAVVSALIKVETCNGKRNRTHEKRLMIRADFREQKAFALGLKGLL